MEKEIVVRNKWSERYPVVQLFPEIGRTKPEFKESCDVNNILRKYANTGTWNMMKQDPRYGDFSNPVDYQEALNIHIEAEEKFMDLPAEVRKKFDNDPLKFLEGMQDEQTRKELFGEREESSMESTPAGADVEEGSENPDP